MKRLKTRILRIVTLDTRPTNDNLDLVVNQRQPDVTRALQTCENESSVPIIVHPCVPKLDQCFPEITAMEFNDLFPGDIESVYDQATSIETIQRQNANYRIQRSNAIAINGTSFLDLPRELRDQIYKCVLTSSNKVWKLRPKLVQDRSGRTRIREQLPKLFYAVPLLSQEVLEMHYKCSTLHFVAVENESRAPFFEWMQHRGAVLIKHIRCIKIRHRMNINGPHSPLCSRGYIATRIEKELDGGLSVDTSHGRSHIDCQCGIAGLVQERLSREDALADTDCIQRIEKSTEYGPVLGFVLQLLEAVRLAQDRERTVMDLPDPRRRLYLHGRNRKNCTMCGKRKWGFQY